MVNQSLDPIIHVLLSFADDDGFGVLRAQRDHGGFLIGKMELAGGDAAEGDAPQTVLRRQLKARAVARS